MVRVLACIKCLANRCWGRVRSISIPRACGIFRSSRNLAFDEAGERLGSAWGCVRSILTREGLDSPSEIEREVGRTKETLICQGAQTVRIECFSFLVLGN